jgi:hypothetical protein
MDETTVFQDIGMDKTDVHAGAATGAEVFPKKQLFLKRPRLGVGTPPAA